MMTIPSSSALWLLTGLDAVVLAVLGAILFMYMRGKRRDTAGLSELIRTIKENEPAQLEALRASLKEQYGQSDDDAAENAKKLAKVKKTFYKHLINVHLARDGEAFVSIDPRLDELLTAYRTLMPIAAEQPEQTAQDPPPAEANTTESTQENDFSAEVEELKRQNDELKQELEKSQRALDEALNEYASAYSGGAEAGKERLEHEKHKLHDHKEHQHHEETMAPPAPPPEATQESPEEDQLDAALGGAVAEVTAQEPTVAPEETAQTPAEAQSQDEIDALMNGMPNLEGIHVEEVDDSDLGKDSDAPETDATAAAKDKPLEQAVEESTQ